MIKDTKCPICGNTAQSGLSSRDSSQYECPQCGNFELTGSTRAVLPGRKIKIHVLSAYIRKQSDMGLVPTITVDDLERIAAYPEASMVEKIDMLLLAFAEDLEHFNQEINLTDKKYIAKACAKDEREYQYLYSQALWSKKFLVSSDSQRFRISVEGWIYVESLKQKTNSTQAFVAMSFHSSMTPIWKNGIESAFSGTGYIPLRIDGKEHNDKIDDQIIAEIQRSRFVVADFTGHRGGVYFEAGYALGRGIPVIWTCRKDDMEKLHFDIRQYNTIDWTDASDLKERLHQRIRATIGEQQ